MTQSEFERALAENLADIGWCVESGDRMRYVNRSDVKDALDILGSLLYGELSNGPSIRKMSQGEKPPAITVRGIGRFSVRFKKARPKRMGRNPATGESIQIAAKPASKKLHFVPQRDAKAEIEG